jgi:hypothetical protein
MDAEVAARSPGAAATYPDGRVTPLIDDSAGNPRRPPGPVRDVRWGEGTGDEMCFASLRVTVDGEHPGRPPDAPAGGGRASGGP